MSLLINFPTAMRKPNLSVILILLALIGCSKDPELREVTVPEFSVTAIPATKVRYDSAFDILGQGFPEVPVGVRVTVSDVEANFTIVGDSLISVLVSRAIPSGPGTVRVFRLDEEIFNSELRVLMELVRDTIVNFRAIGSDNVPDDGPFRRFDFIEGISTGSATEWDMAIRGTTIAVNGGEQVGVVNEPVRNGEAGVTLVDRSFDQVTSVDELVFSGDAPGAWAIPDEPDLGWYQVVNNIVEPIPGRTLVFRTRNGLYAKVEVLNYYRNSPPNPDPEQDRHYTFRYIFNPNLGETYLE